LLPAGFLRRLRLAFLEDDLEVLTGNGQRLLAVAIVAREHAGGRP
jgi:hypothetical protein